MKKYSFTAFTLFLIVAMIGISMVGCESTDPQTQTESEYALERDDLIMVNLTTVKASFGSMGIYVFFFEDYPTTGAYPIEVQIRIDPLVDEPIIRAKSLKEDISSPSGLYAEVMYGVEIFFRDMEQMQEYWIV